jgi:ubiquitin-conjugating enzyme E2 G2
MSVLSMLAEPNIESGANIEVSPSGSFIKLVDIGLNCWLFVCLQCCKMYRDNLEEYERVVRRQVRQQLGIEDEEDE